MIELHYHHHIRMLDFISTFYLGKKVEEALLAEKAVGAEKLREKSTMFQLVSLSLSTYGERCSWSQDKRIFGPIRTIRRVKGAQSQRRANGRKEVNYKKDFFSQFCSSNNRRVR